MAQTDADSFGKLFREGLRDAGFVEGRNISIDIRSANGNAAALPSLAAELVRQHVDIIVAVYTPCARAAKEATSEIPIVATVVADPIGTGLVASLSQPGGNVTGLSNMAPETAAKSVELFRDIIPSLSRVGLLANPADPFTRPLLQHVELAGRSTGVEIMPVMARGADEVEAAFAALDNARVQAVVVQGIFFPTTIADLAIKHRLPSASVLPSFPRSGGLMSYGADIPHLFQHTATYVQKILQGARPADLPVEQPTKFNLTINLKTAKAIGLAIPDTFVLRADEVIE